MPHQPLIASARLRSAVTTAVMLLILLAALGTARLMSTDPDTGTGPQRVGTLELSVPHAWRRAATAAPAPGLQVHARFDSRSGDRQLTVALLPDGPARAPLDAVDLALNLLLDERQRLTFQPLYGAASARVGTWLVFTVTGGTGGGGAEAAHVAAVLTEDGGRYWILWLHLPRWRYPQKADVDRAERRLRAICRTAIDHQRRDAAAADFEAARLNPTAPAMIPGTTLRARCDLDRSPGDPIELIAAEGQSLLPRARVLGTFDSGVDDPDDPLSPVRLLQATFRDATGRVAGDHEQWAGRIDLGTAGASVAAWRVTWESGAVPADAERSPAERWSRAVYYLRLPGGRGMLVELTGQASGSEERNAWVPALVSALAPPGEAGGSGQAGFAAAVERGAALVDAVHQRMPEQVQPGMSYDLLERFGYPIGFGVTRTAVRSRDGPPSWSGQRLQRTATSLAANQVTQWAGSLDGWSFSWRRNSRPPGQTATVVEHLIGDRANLGARRTLADQTQESLWVAARPLSYLSPLALDAWPVAWLTEADGGPALVWQCADPALPPRPYWVELVKAGQTTSVDDRLVQLRLRPLLALDADRLTIDRTGRTVARYHVQRRSVGATPGRDPAGEPDGDSQSDVDSDPESGVEHDRANRLGSGLGDAPGMVTRQVTRQAVLEIFPDSAAALEQWEKEELADE